MWTLIYTRVDNTQDSIMEATFPEAVMTARQFRDYPEVLKVEIYTPDGVLLATFTNYKGGF
jgi:hypothetical protein